MLSTYLISLAYILMKKETKKKIQFYINTNASLAFVSKEITNFGNTFFTQKVVLLRRLSVTNLIKYHNVFLINKN